MGLALGTLNAKNHMRKTQATQRHAHPDVITTNQVHHLDIFKGKKPKDTHSMTSHLPKSPSKTLLPTTSCAFSLPAGAVRIPANFVRPAPHIAHRRNADGGKINSPHPHALFHFSFKTPQQATTHATTTTTPLYFDNHWFWIDRQLLFILGVYQNPNELKYCTGGHPLHH